MSLLPILLLTAAAASGGYHRLQAEQATASSYLENNWNKFSENYHPNYILDDDPKTAWVEGAKADGVGESIEVRTSPLSSARSVKLRIRNGYQKSKPLLKKNAAVKQLTVALLHPSGAVTHEEKVTLARKNGWQDVVVKVPPKTAFAGVRLTINSVHRGSVYRDTCLSDVQIWADSDVTYNKKVEDSKHASLRAWIKGRKADAKYFKKLPKQYPFVATHFDRAEISKVQVENMDEETDNGFVPLAIRWKKRQFTKAWSDLFDKADLETFRSLEAWSKNAGKTFGSGLYKVVVKAPPKAPDGLDISTSDFVMPYLIEDQMSLFEAKNKSVDVLKERAAKAPRDFYRKYLIGTPRVEWRTEQAKRPKRIYTWEHTVVEERGVYETRTGYLLVYDDGKLSRQYVLRLGTESIEMQRIDFTWTGAKVSVVDVRSAQGWVEFGTVGSNRYVHERYSGRTSVAAR